MIIITMQEGIFRVANADSERDALIEFIDNHGDSILDEKDIPCENAYTIAVVIKVGIEESFFSINLQ